MLQQITLTPAQQAQYSAVAGNCDTTTKEQDAQFAAANSGALIPPPGTAVAIAGISGYVFKIDGLYYRFT